MLSTEQSKNIVWLYTKLLENENGWGNMDNYLEKLQWLEDDQVYREADALYSTEACIMARDRPHHSFPDA